MNFIQVGPSHPRNEESFIRGCLLFNINYKKVDSISQITEFPTLIWSNSWIDPKLFPKTKFLFGPQFFVFPSTDGPLATCSTPDIDSRCVYNCLSNWNIKIHQLFLQNPKVPYICLPFGVDTDNLKPILEVPKKNQVLVYYKNRNTYELQIVLDILKENTIDYILIKYGTYNNNEYHTILHESKLCIWVGRHESQGFAFQEALSIGVPLLVYDVTDMKQEVNNNNQSYYSNYLIPLPASAASYWDPMCGEKTDTPSELPGLLKKMLDNLDNYKPREYIINTLSDKVCFKRLLDTFNL
jgi:hypothetical protein